MESMLNNKWTMWFLRKGKSIPYCKPIDDEERSDGSFEEWVSTHKEFIETALEKRRAYARAYSRRKHSALTKRETDEIKARRINKHEEARKERKSEYVKKIRQDDEVYDKYVALLKKGVTKSAALSIIMEKQEKEKEINKV